MIGLWIVNMKNTPHQLTENVKLLQKVVLWHRDQFLILQRSTASPTRPNCWDLPGGNVEWPSSTIDLKDAHLIELTREVEEETGLTIVSHQANSQQSNINQVGRPGSYNQQALKNCYISTFFESSRQIYTIIVGWQYQLPESTESPRVVLSDEHQNYAWIKSTDFDRYDFGFAGEEGGFIRRMIRSSVELIENK